MPLPHKNQKLDLSLVSNSVHSAPTLTIPGRGLNDIIDLQDPAQINRM